MFSIGFLLSVFIHKITTMVEKLFPYPKKKSSTGAWKNLPPTKMAWAEKIPPPEMEGLFGVGYFFSPKTATTQPIVPDMNKTNPAQ
jgi:hypothetical protein